MHDKCLIHKSYKSSNSHQLQWLILVVNFIREVSRILVKYLQVCRALPEIINETGKFVMNSGSASQ